MKRIILALALALVAGMASTAAADRGAPGHRQGPMRQRLLEQFDHNHDGRLTGREKRAAKKFVMRMRFERRMMALRERGAERAERPDCRGRQLRSDGM